MYYDLKQNFPGVRNSCESEYYKLLNKNYTYQEALKVVERIDWDFKGYNTQYLTHKIHSYPARFIPQIPFSFIKLFSKEKDTILDSFCGCGTTLVESFLNNRNSIGVDFNPLGILISKVKTTLLSENDIYFLEKKTSKLKNNIYVSDQEINSSYINLPNRKSRDLFSYSVIKDLLQIKELLKRLKEEERIDIFNLWRVALSSTILSIVNGYNTIPIKNLFLNKIKSMILEIKRMKKLISNGPKVVLFEGDSRNLLVENNSVDLIITSPPYVNALDYHQIHMYNMAWLGMDYRHLKKHEIGCHSHHIENRFRLLSEYLGDMLRSLIEMNRVLKNDKLAILIVGNSSLEYEKIESYKFISRLSKEVGFNPIKIFKRSIDSDKKHLKKEIGKINEEFIVILKKNDEAKALSNDNKFISVKVREEMIRFSRKIQIFQGTSVRLRSPSKKRLLRNIEKIESAIKTIPYDIRIKT